MRDSSKYTNNKKSKEIRMNVYFIIMAHLIYLNYSGISGINIEIKILLGIDAFPARP